MTLPVSYETWKCTAVLTETRYSSPF